MKTDNSQILQASRLQSFLNEHRAEKDKPYNFTGYARPQLGRYYIPEDKLGDFYSLYTGLIQRHEVMPYLTEKPGQFSPIVIDLDFKFPLSEESIRKYDETFKETVVGAYFEGLERYLELDDESAQCYLFERSAPYKTENNVKDGLHMIFPYLTTPASIKLVLRDFVMKKCRDIFESLQTENTISDIVDLAVIQRNNWFMYGSGKPGCEAYKLTEIYDRNLNKIPFEHDLRELVPTLSVRGTTAPNISFKDDMEEEFDADYVAYTNRASLSKGKQTKSRLAGNLQAPESRTSSRAGMSASTERQTANAGDIASGSQPAMRNMNRKSKFDTCENLDFVKGLVTILNPERADEYSTWIEVGWALHNVDHDLLNTWIEFSEQSCKFEEGVCERYWKDMREEGLGIGSIVRWARHDNDDAYDRLRTQDIKTLMEMAISSGGAHHSLARILYGMYRYNFVCLSRKFRSWIEFRGHRWYRTEDGYGLLIQISNKLYKEFSIISGDYALRIAAAPEEQKKAMEDRRTVANKIGTRLLDSNFKANVMKEAYELFYIEGFEDKLDTNQNLIGFENGVYDLEKMEFRDGRPEDCITLDRLRIEAYYVKIMEKLISQLHTKEAIRWSFLSGSTKQQKFHTLTTGIDYEEYESNAYYVKIMEKLISQLHTKEAIRDYVLKLMEKRRFRSFELLPVF